MGALTAILVQHPSELKPLAEEKTSIFLHNTRRRIPTIKTQSIVPLTLAISHTKNNSQLQGWYNKLQRDEVVAEWKNINGTMSLHVHCHISGGHFLLDLFASLRYYIFCKELPVVLKAFIHGDKNLFRNYPELEQAFAWVYFHSNTPEFNKVECWGPLIEAASPSSGASAIQSEAGK
ncbi:unnamed protein product [Fraxinus pennsylvanica]|uniref:Staygreen protein domain-containing protein n=1 Tax=Fraxinus pennsylvanica TaxID=56036 RepID=A0AAD2DL56_9LAMI|nr:unnamed protein product [Fraxinus pennsylvanica]